MAKNATAHMAQKVDSLENWQKATGFVPMEGEFFLVKDYDYPIIIGDGKTNAAQLCLKPTLSSIANEDINDLFRKEDMNNG